MKEKKLHVRAREKEMSDAMGRNFLFLLIFLNFALVTN